MFLTSLRENSFRHFLKYENKFEFSRFAFKFFGFLKKVEYDWCNLLIWSSSGVILSVSLVFLNTGV